MKKIFFTLVAIMSATLSLAQNTLVATLTHGDEVTMYYGVDAFKNAHNAAASGDVINLSGGSYTGFTFTKAITVRGTGIDASNPTSISSMMSFDITENDNFRLSVEGIRFDGASIVGTFSNPCFLKCLFNRVVTDSSSHIENALFVDCKITEYFYLFGSTSAVFLHCFIQTLTVKSSDSSTAQCVNCVLNGYFTNYRHSSFVNCILCCSSQTTNIDYYKLPAETQAMNCTAFNSDNDYYYNNQIYSAMQGNAISCSTSTYEAVFKDYSGGYSDSQQFELTDAAKTQYLGTDGTEIGLYGGQYPYNTTPTYPRITNLTVDKQTTADDKLNVEIEVSSAE